MLLITKMPGFTAHAWLNYDRKTVNMKDEENWTPVIDIVDDP
jgi:hypothetical protein